MLLPTLPSVKCCTAYVWSYKDNWWWCLSLSLTPAEPGSYHPNSCWHHCFYPFPWFSLDSWVTQAHWAALVTWHSKDFRASQSGGDNAGLAYFSFVHTVATQVHEQTTFRFLCVSCDSKYFSDIPLVYKTFTYIWPHFTHSTIYPFGIIKIWSKCSVGEICVWELSLNSKNILNFIDLGLYFYFATFSSGHLTYLSQSLKLINTYFARLFWGLSTKWDDTDKLHSPVPNRKYVLINF